MQSIVAYPIIEPIGNQKPNESIRTGWAQQPRGSRGMVPVIHDKSTKVTC